MHLAATQRQQTEQLLLCWRLRVLHWETVCMFKPWNSLFLGLFNSKILFVLVMLVIFLRIEPICLVVLHPMNTFLKLGGQILCQFLAWQNCLGLIEQGVHARVLYHRESRLKEIFFFLQKLSFPSRNIRGKEKKIEIQIIFNNTFFNFWKFWLVENSIFPPHKVILEMYWPSATVTPLHVTIYYLHFSSAIWKFNQRLWAQHYIPLTPNQWLLWGSIPKIKNDSCVLSDGFQYSRGTKMQLLVKI